MITKTKGFQLIRTYCFRSSDTVTVERTVKVLDFQGNPDGSDIHPTL